MTLEQIEQFLESLSSLGPLPGIAAPFIEAFLPFLPLIVIIMANVNIYGFGLGLLFSWLGVVLGSMCVFLLCRRFGNKARNYITKKVPASDKMFKWIEKRGFSAVFIVMCFPFTPSIVVTIVAALSRIQFKTFLVSMLCGKLIMISAISIISFDFVDLLHSPFRLILSIIAIILLWYGGKQIEKYFNK